VDAARRKGEKRGAPGAWGYGSGVGTRSGEKCLSSSCAPAGRASERRSVPPAAPAHASPGPSALAVAVLRVLERCGAVRVAGAVGGRRFQEGRGRQQPLLTRTLTSATRGAASQVAVCAVSRPSTERTRVSLVLRYSALRTAGGPIEGLVDDTNRNGPGPLGGPF
jgi:hypothetical protein